MFNERMALKARLEELDIREVRVAKECREEREWIYAKLHKLDEQARYFPQNASLLHEENPALKEQGMVDRSEQQIESDETQIEEGMKDYTKEIEQVVEKTIEPIINGFKQSLEKEKEEKAQLLISMEESTNAINKFEKILQRTTIQNQEKKTNTRKRTARGTIRTNKEPIDYSPLNESALTILKQHTTASIPSPELKKNVESHTGVKIPNMTQFMQRLMDKHPQIEKPFRGEYFYRQDDEEQVEELNERVDSEEVLQPNDNLNEPEEQTGEEE